MWRYARPSQLMQCACLGGLLLAICTVPGCGGCNADLEDAKDAKTKLEKKTKPKPDFERMKLMVQPSDADENARMAKPGHWQSATLEAKAKIKRRRAR